jgi:hypothetical protein
MWVSSGSVLGIEGGKGPSPNSYPSGDVLRLYPRRLVVAAEVPLY